MQQYCKHRPAVAAGKSMPVAALLRATTNNYATPHIRLTRDGLSPERTRSAGDSSTVRDRCDHHPHHHHHHRHHHDDHYPTYAPSSTDCFAPADSVQPIMNRQEYHERLAVAEALSRTSMMTSPAARRRLAARKVEIDLMAGNGHGNEDEGYWDEDFDYVPPKQLLMYMVR